jgi:hypothetical protein
MPQVGFEPTIPVFERQKTVRASDRSAVGSGTLRLRGAVNILITSHAQLRQVDVSVKGYSFHSCDVCLWSEHYLV